MSNTGQEEHNNPEILSVIQDNLHRDDFAKYINFCVKKWKRLEVELEIVDAIMSSICKQWKISKQDLIQNKKFSEPRSMMYYVIKKQVKLSYREIGEMFSTRESYIHKAVHDITFLVEEHRQKDMVNIFESIQNDLSAKNVIESINAGLKS